MNIKELFEAAGYDTRSYSGRGMYGNTCLGVDCNSRKTATSIIVDVLLTAVDNLWERSELDDLGEMLKMAEEDSMGMGSILYFPDIPYSE